MMEKRQPLQEILMKKVVINLQKTETRSRFTTLYYYQLKMHDFNIRPETLMLVQERAANTLEVLGIVKDFLSRIPAAQSLRERMDK
jgi:hypothetical protein